MKYTTHYDSEENWLSFLVNGEEKFGFSTPEPMDYAELAEEWESGEMLWNRLGDTIRTICEG